MRILGLHGFQTSSKIFTLQSNYLRRLLAKEHPNIEWIIPDAPHESKENISPIVERIFKPPFYHWYDKNNGYYGLEESVEFLKKLGPIDGIIGFSQGACMAQIISTILKPKFVINVCGVNYPEYNTIIEIPCLNIIGTEDPIKERSEKLASQYINSEIIYHSGCHTFPPEIITYQKIVFFIKNNKI